MVKHRCAGESKTLNVLVPAEAYWHVRRCATESHLSMKEYMARFCLEARPYLPDSLQNDPSTLSSPSSEPSNVPDHNEV